MNKIKTILNILVFSIILAAPLAGENLSITQMDTSSLFLKSKIDCYVRITEGKGNQLDIKNFSSVISVLQKDEKETELEITDIKRNNDNNERITFMLVIDNSGSMYDKTKDSEISRINAAVTAAGNFLKNLDSEKDRGGLALFNREYRLLEKPDKIKNNMDDVFTAIEKPSKEESYTELYYTVVKAAGELGKITGRKAVILLSDGENYPYHEKSGKPHPVYGTDKILPDDALNALSDNEVTLYAVNFSGEKDIPLSKIAIASGGKVFDASNESELTGVYKSIKKGIEEEYRISVKVPVSFSKSPEIEVVLNDSYKDSRTYSPALVFGAGRLKTVLPAFIIIFAGALIWAALFMLKLEKSASQAELTQLPAGRGKALEKTMLLTSANTVIGGANSADYTITGVPEISDSHATIVHNEKTDAYTLVSAKDVRVNNNLVKKRKLTPGDVINIEGAAMVFDAPDKTIIK